MTLPAVKTDAEIIFEKGGFFKGYKNVAIELRLLAEQLQAELNAERELNKECKALLDQATAKLTDIQEIILNP